MSKNQERSDCREDQGWNGHAGRYVGNITIVAEYRHAALSTFSCSSSVASFCGVAGNKEMLGVQVE